MVYSPIGRSLPVRLHGKNFPTRTRKKPTAIRDSLEKRDVPAIGDPTAQWFRHRPTPFRLARSRKTGRKSHSSSHKPILSLPKEKAWRRAQPPAWSLGARLEGALL